MQEGKVLKKDEEWKRELTKEQYDVARRHGTERPFSGKYWNAKDKGTYCCVCCGSELFSSDTKFESGTGWPSFWKPVGDDRVTHRDDHSYGTTRVEVLCSKCDAHLGHVFDDGPAPTYKRYCINSVSLNLAKEQKG